MFGGENVFGRGTTEPCAALGKPRIRPINAVRWTTDETARVESANFDGTPGPPFAAPGNDVAARRKNPEGGRYQHVA
jgi:hypothetical protein